MILFYNILQLILAPLLILLLPLYLVRHPEKQGVVLPRLGFGLKSQDMTDSSSPTIWVHALSVGEVTSALPLIQTIRHEIPHCTLIFSATTSSGRRLATSIIRPSVDEIVPFPLDIRFVVNLFIKRLRPDLFILVETDFWPNFLNCLTAHEVPSLLVNGRVSERSMRLYLRYGFFFKRVFNQFSLLSMQTVQDAKNMQRLGIASAKLKTLGNLKFTAPSQRTGTSPNSRIGIRAGRLTIICGSTHDGEETIIVKSYSNLRQKGYKLHLVIAPRQIDRSDAIADLARSAGLSVERYSVSTAAKTDITIVDTLGDLATLYAFSDITFIGGSLVPEGGHNPLEAARQQNPILFGPFMDDFSEISAALLEHKGAFQVTDQDSFQETLERLITSEEFRREASTQAKCFTNEHRNVLTEHITLIKQFM